eukprot:gb/GECH01007200.1/.p1 GENE.gb/GECH01007200.1/~~gb/GECH01007200.1/.p1  ORF type:complete len:791 (+),score=168.03 gb/GECH01007200.1/:1-2373(+)
MKQGSLLNLLGKQNNNTTSQQTETQKKSKKRTHDKITTKPNEETNSSIESSNSKKRRKNVIEDDDDNDDLELQRLKSEEEQLQQEKQLTKEQQDQSSSDQEEIEDDEDSSENEKISNAKIYNSVSETLSKNSKKTAKGTTEKNQNLLLNAKYDPSVNATWKKGKSTPYMHLANAFSEIEKESGRIKITEILTNAFRTVIKLNPEDLLYCVYLASNTIAPAHEGIELGVGEGTLIKALAEATGKSTANIKANYKSKGDLGIVARVSKSSQSTLGWSKPASLTVARVYQTLREIATASGKSSLKQKISKIKSLLVACQGIESQYIVRHLQGKMRIGLAEQTILVSLAHAIVLSPPSSPDSDSDKSTSLKPSELEKKLDKASETLKMTYSELPVFDVIIPTLLKDGSDEDPFERLRERCLIQPGIPVRPMLAKPTKGISEILDRLSNCKFTCEWKYDGERAQIHVLSPESISIFSRNAENHTGKYPDIVKMLPQVMNDNTQNCIIDCEVVAWDKEKDKILPFQVLSTRGKKNIQLDDIKVSVCVFAFDILYLNGKSLLKMPLTERREQLHSSFSTIQGSFEFAKYLDPDDSDAIQPFLDEAVAGNCEGLMVKTLDKDATYEPARRTFNWLKLKKDYMDGTTDSLDLVPIGGYAGRGKRTGGYGGFLLACIEPETDEMQSICKIGSGFSDDMLKQLSSQLKDTVIPKPKSYYSYPNTPNLLPDVWFDDKYVWEVRAADLSLSPAHTAATGLAHPSKGIALRFPRIVRVRDDKGPESATTAQQVMEMYFAQSNIQ